jgi:hypothetical protein
VDISKTKVITFINKFYAKKFYTADKKEEFFLVFIECFPCKKMRLMKYPNSLQENIVPYSLLRSENNFTSISLKNHLKSTAALSSFITVLKRYLSNPKHSSFLKERKNDKTKSLCFRLVFQ